MTTGGDPSPGGRRLQGSTRIDRLVNAVLDAESEGDVRRAKQLRATGSMLPGFSQALQSAREAASSMAVLPESPDFGPSVLLELEGRGAIRTRARKRRVSVGRVALAAGALGAFAVAMIMQRVSPPPLPQGAPVSELVTTAEADFAASVESLGGAMLTLRESLFEPVGTLVASSSTPHPSLGLELGNTDAYEVRSRQAGTRPPTRLAMISVPEAPDRALPPIASAPGRRLAEAAPSLLVPAPMVLSKRTAAPATFPGNPGEVWLLWDGSGWSTTPAGEGRR
ncbi:MAG: hypothetical protein DYG92_00990 [Leptolyngbya sp. PLA1]|nr:hypothetical protein [Leptolyngbya sp. PLA1]